MELKEFLSLILYHQEEKTMLLWESGTLSLLYVMTGGRVSAIQIHAPLVYLFIERKDPFSALASLRLYSLYHNRHGIINHSIMDVCCNLFETIPFTMKYSTSFTKIYIRSKMQLIVI